MTHFRAHSAVFENPEVPVSIIALFAHGLLMNDFTVDETSILAVFVADLAVVVHDVILGVVLLLKVVPVHLCIQKPLPVALGSTFPYLFVLVRILDNCLAHHSFHLAQVAEDKKRLHICAIFLAFCNQVLMALLNDTIFLEPDLEGRHLGQMLIIVTYSLLLARKHIALKLQVALGTRDSLAVNVQFEVACCCLDKAPVTLQEGHVLFLHNRPITADSIWKNKVSVAFWDHVSIYSDHRAMELTFIFVRGVHLLLLFRPFLLHEIFIFCALLSLQ